MSKNYEYSITKVNYIINRLSQDDKDKLPNNIINFFDVNSNDELLQDDFTKSKNLLEMCDETDKNFLKIIDYYINK